MQIQLSSRRSLLLAATKVTLVQNPNSRQSGKQIVNPNYRLRYSTENLLRTAVHSRIRLADINRMDTLNEFRIQVSTLGQPSILRTRTSTVS